MRIYVEVRVDKSKQLPPGAAQGRTTTLLPLSIIAFSCDAFCHDVWLSSHDV